MNTPNIPVNILTGISAVDINLLIISTNIKKHPPNIKDIEKFCLLSVPQTNLDKCGTDKPIQQIFPHIDIEQDVNNVAKIIQIVLNAFILKPRDFASKSVKDKEPVLHDKINPIIIQTIIGIAPINI